MSDLKTAGKTAKEERVSHCAVCGKAVYDQGKDQPAWCDEHSEAGE